MFLLSSMARPPDQLLHHLEHTGSSACGSRTYLYQKPEEKTLYGLHERSKQLSDTVVWNFKVPFPSSLLKSILCLPCQRTQAQFCLLVGAIWANFLQTSQVHETKVLWGFLAMENVVVMSPPSKRRWRGFDPWLGIQDPHTWATKPVCQDMRSPYISKGTQLSQNKLDKKNCKKQKQK